jgi:hypothetical protein
MMVLVGAKAFILGFRGQHTRKTAPTGQPCARLAKPELKPEKRWLQKLIRAYKGCTEFGGRQHVRIINRFDGQLPQRALRDVCGGTAVNS